MEVHVKSGIKWLSNDVLRYEHKLMFIESETTLLSLQLPMHTDTVRLQLDYSAVTSSMNLFTLVRQVETRMLRSELKILVTGNQCITE